MIKKSKSHEVVDAVSYCRVSSHKQTVQGHGLASQATRCREYIDRKGYNFLRNFNDDISGGSKSRPGMQQLLDYLSERPTGRTAVVIDDISRLARGIDAHIALRASIDIAGGILESPSIEFGEDSDAQLVENLLACVSQHHRQKISEQTHNRMRARMQNGYWPFHPPQGYRFELRKGFGKVLVLHDAKAPVIREALTQYAYGRLRSQAEVTRYLNRSPVFTKSKGVWFRQHNVKALLSNTLYCGYFAKPDWEVPWTRAVHEPLITVAEHRMILKRLAEQAPTASRKDLSLDFPLRGFVLCEACSAPLTAYWATSHTGKRHPYYHCHKRVCTSYGKPIRRATLEEEFIEILRRLTPSELALTVAAQMFDTAWKAQASNAKRERNQLSTKIAEIEERIERIVDQIVDGPSERVRVACEARLDKLERERTELREELAALAAVDKKYPETLELTKSFLRSPWKAWRDGDFRAKVAVQRLTLSERIVYCRGEGLRTPQTTFPFKVLDNISTQGGSMAARRSVKPMSHRPS